MSIRRLIAMALAAPVVLAQPAVAEDRPATHPTRDVDVTYAMADPGRPAGDPMTQRMRWAADSGRVRVDPPSAQFYVVTDMPARRMWAVRESDRTVAEMEARGAPGLPDAAAFARLGEAEVAGLPCTEWATRDATGHDVIACITLDGVLLRARRGAAVLVQATRVAYGPVPDAVFAIPPDYRRIDAGSTR